MHLTRISPRFWLARQTVLASLALPFLALFFTLGLTIRGLALIEIPLSLAVVALVWAVERGRYLSWGYAEREDDLVVSRGLLFRRLTVVPYGRMQLIDVTAGPIARAFGIATVQLHTAAAATDARIPGLEREQAERLRDRLAAIGEARATGL